MKCPHCLENFHDEWEKYILGSDEYNTGWYAFTTKCPSCLRMVISLKNALRNGAVQSRIVEPKGIARSPLSGEVVDPYAQDYKEACDVLTDSCKASAALSRRCLQLILRDKAAVEKQDLSKEIQEVIDSGKLPTYLSEAIDAIRNIGNFAAHPLKSTNTGEIIEVEPGEAEWMLDVLEQLFDFYFVQPAILQRKKDALNGKLKEAGKPEMK